MWLLPIPLQTVVEFAGATPLNCIHSRFVSESVVVSMSSPQIHIGEHAVQERAGVASIAERTSGMYRREMSSGFDAFLRAQAFVVISGLDAQGQPWASALSGTPGFARATDSHTVGLTAKLEPDDPLFAGLKPGAALGLLAINLANRGRIRINGNVSKFADNQLEFRSEQVYGNCPKYIQARDLTQTQFKTSIAQHGSSLTERQVDWLQRTDTLFIASTDPQGGADASHRGGQPGFVQVVNTTQIVIPDYSGNNLFNTLGNIQSTGRAGLLLIDFETGDTLQVTGRARIDWDKTAISRIPGAERLVRLEVEAMVERKHSFPLLGKLLEYSPHNPKIKHEN